MPSRAGKRATQLSFGVRPQKKEKAMGLSQSFRFKYDHPEDIEKIFHDLRSDYIVHQKGDLYVIKDNGNSFTFDAAVAEYGLDTHRSGEYFHVLGLLVEALTGKFGQIQIEDK
jgi:hypothetical protein